jgi:hypothetical protein
MPDSDISDTDCPGSLGRAIPQAVSRRLPTAAGRVRAQVRSCGIYGGQSGIEAAFLRVLRFPLPVRIPPIASPSSSSTWGWYSKRNSGPSTKLTHSHPMRKKSWELFRCVPQTSHANAGIVPQSRSQPLSIQLIIPLISIDPVQSELMTSKRVHTSTCSWNCNWKIKFAVHALEES